MAKEHNITTQPWGSLEELLLACAVHRYGTESWETIAQEVQVRTSDLPLLTPQNCINKFNELKQRFQTQHDAGSASPCALAHMIEELRALRIKELKMEVQQQGISIMSKELRLKRFMKEREASLKEEAEDEKMLVVTKQQEAGNNTLDGQDVKVKLEPSLQDNMVWKSKNQGSDAHSSARLSMRKQHESSRLNTAQGSHGTESKLSVMLLEKIRRHRFVSMFQQCLSSQESEMCRNLIRQHVDFDTIQSRFERGEYLDSATKLFRDLLLLFNNALVIFRKDSEEHVAAQELRTLVSNELSNNLLPVKPEPQGVPFPKTNKASRTVVCGITGCFELADKNNDINGSSGAGVRKMKKQTTNKLRRKNSNKKDLKYKIGTHELGCYDPLDAKVYGNTGHAKKRRGATRFFEIMNQSSLSEVVDDDDDDDDGDDNDKNIDFEAEKERNRTRDDTEKTKTQVDRPPKRQAAKKAKPLWGSDNSDF